MRSGKTRGSSGAALFAILFFCATTLQAKKLEVKRSNVAFLSSAPMETIRGAGATATGTVDLSLKTVRIAVRLADFSTGQSRRDEHLRERYLQVEQFPEAVFEGKITSGDENSENITVTGIMRLHGVVREGVVLTGALRRENGLYNLKSSFVIRLSDYNIEIPKFVIMKLSDEISVTTELFFEVSE